MKKTFLTSAILLGYFMLMSTFGIIASVPANVNSAAKEQIRKEISSQIICPSFVTENSELNDVKAIVRVDETGKVNVLEINSGNEQLKEYVITELGKMKIKNPATTDEFVLVIKFRVV
jgi:AICAR transformylase/IMP cyclohydrolase PurH